MEVRGLRWVPLAADEPMVLGDWLAEHDDGRVNTGELTPERLQDLLGAWGPDIHRSGSLLLECVVEAEDTVETLLPWLELCAPQGPAEAAEYVLFDDPVSSYSVASLGPDGVDDASAAQFRAFDVVEAAFAPAPDDELSALQVVSRPLRTISNERVALVFWRPVIAYFSRPEPRGGRPWQPARQLPGRIVADPRTAAAVARGVPAGRVHFEEEWGGGGPRALRKAMGHAAKDPSVMAPALLEDLLAQIVTDARDVTLTVIERAHARLERSLLLAGATNEPTRGTERLAVVATACGLLESSMDDAAEPEDHAGPHWYAPTGASATIELGLGDVRLRLERFNGRF